MRSTRALSLLAAIVIAAGSIPAAQQPATAADIPRIAFEKYALANGLEVILSQDRRLPMVAVNLWYHVGPANEVEGRTGFAHLFEHMMFQSSKHVPQDAHFRLLEAAGASDINGTTDYDRTNYFATVPANQLELALWLESDRMGYLIDVLDAPALANQQDVVRNERRQGVENPPYGIVEEAVVQMLYPKGHPYYSYVIGSHADLQAAKLEDVKSFFKQYYAPNNASLAIVGDFETADAKRLVEKYFGTLKRGPAVPPIEVKTPPVTSERRRVVTDRVELPRVYMAWITSPIFGPGDADAQVAAGVLGGGRSSRLYKKLVYEKQIAQDVTAQQESLMLGSIFRIQATARPGHTAEEIEKAIDEELAAFAAAPPDSAEVERAKTTIETQIVQGLETLGGFGGVADRLNMYNHFLKDPDYLQKDIERFRAVMPASVHALAREQLRRDARVVVHAVPGEKQLGPEVSTPPAPAAKPGEGAESINADEPWRNEPPKPGPVRTLAIPQPEAVKLANGLTIILSRRPGLPVVAANLVVKAGSDANPIGKPGLASFTAAMLDEGTATRSALQIADEVAQYGAQLTIGSTMDATQVQARSLARTFPKVLDIVADVALRPSFPAEEIERQRASRLAQLVQQRDSAAALAGKITAAALYGPQHPYGYTEIGTEASVKTLGRSDMLGFWKEQYVPNNAALIVAGNISMEELRPVVEKAFGGWKPGTPRRPALASAAGTQAKIVIVDKPGAPQTELRVAAVGLPRSTPDFHAVEVMNTALGGLFSSRINMNLREQHGYTYGAFSTFVFRRGPGPFLVGSGVRTDVTAPAVAEMFKEIRGMVERPLSAEELQKSKDSLALSLPGAFERSDAVAGSFANVFIYDLGLDYFAKYASRVNAIDFEQAVGTARKHLRPDRMVVIAVGDRMKIEPELRKLDLGPVEVRDTEGRVQRPQ
jgi:zinc protease